MTRPRRRAPGAVIVVAAALLASIGAGTPDVSPRSGPVIAGSPATLSGAVAFRSERPRADAAPSVPPLPVPPVPLPGSPLVPAPARQLTVPPLSVPPLPAIPLPSVPLGPRPGQVLLDPSVPPPLTRPGPGRPVLPGLGAPLGALPFPRLDGRLLAAAGTLPVAGGPTDTRPGPGPSFTLEARSVTLNGARLRGVTTPPGRRTPSRVPVVRIDVDSATLTAPIIRALHADRGVVETRSRQVARLGGRGQIYIEEITGTLAVAGFPTVPIRLAPGEVTTPGVDLGFLTVPSLTLTDVTARVAFLGAGQLVLPGATFVANAPRP